MNAGENRELLVVTPSLNGVKSLLAHHPPNVTFEDYFVLCHFESHMRVVLSMFTLTSYSCVNG